MSKTSTINARIEPQLKAEAEAIFQRIGLKSSEAITLLYKQVVLNNGLPFAVRIPNQETQDAITDAKQGNNLTTYQNTDDMMNDLWK